MLVLVVLESGVPVLDKSAGDINSWKLCLKFGLEMALFGKRCPSNDVLWRLLVCIGAGIGKVVALGIKFMCERGEG